MHVKVLYFASLREALGQAEEQLDTQAQTVEALLNELCARGPQWQAALCENPHLQIAVNQTVAERTSPLAEGVEVAFFPPVTGG